MVSRGNAGSRLAIVVGGGPAPGINGVISAVTIEAINSGLEVLGISDGFKWLARGDASRVRRLEIDDVSRIHLSGGSILGTSRASPLATPNGMDNVLEGLRELDVGYLVTIGGDGSAYLATRIHENAGDWLATAHVPKTIDNDLPLPGLTPTFGYQTARHVGTGVVHSLSVDGKATGKWYVVVTMGRWSGLLALGIGKAAGATLTVIPEEFGNDPIRFEDLVAVVEGAVVKRLADDSPYGVAVVAEGLAARLSEEDLERFGGIARGEQGELRLSQFDLGERLADSVSRSLGERGVEQRIVPKRLGYELRSVDPIPYDAEYTRNLGYGAVKYLLGGGSGAMISVHGGRLSPIPYGDILDASGERVRVRHVDVGSETYEVARKYMIRLGPEDLDDPERLETLAGTARMTPEAFRERFDFAARLPLLPSPDQPPLPTVSPAPGVRAR